MWRAFIAGQGSESAPASPATVTRSGGYIRVPAPHVIDFAQTPPCRRHAPGATCNREPSLRPTSGRLLPDRARGGRLVGVSPGGSRVPRARAESLAWLAAARAALRRRHAACAPSAGTASSRSPGSRPRAPTATASRPSATWATTCCPPARARCCAWCCSTRARRRQAQAAGHDRRRAHARRDRAGAHVRRSSPTACCPGDVLPTDQPILDRRHRLRAAGRGRPSCSAVLRQRGAADPSARHHPPARRRAARAGRPARRAAARGLGRCCGLSRAPSTSPSRTRSTWTSAPPARSTWSRSPTSPPPCRRRPARSAPSTPRWSSAPRRSAAAGAVVVTYLLLLRFMLYVPITVVGLGRAGRALRRLGAHASRRCACRDPGERRLTDLRI